MQGSFAPAAAGKSEFEFPRAHVASSRRMEKNSPHSPQYNEMTVARAYDVIGQESRIGKSVGRGETGSHGKILVMTNAFCLNFAGGVWCEQRMPGKSTRISW